ncbi:DHA2 family efflux MFS transporter permease subunit [Mycolicibacterium chlorophenolicum]|uniref:Multidrug export protein EmrB n=1 Tax=Mycolicibacterium chlorophenolicum TaxID=37916 RepID=A0A0J6VC74_9MYCO|nr:DHA2 family efflux MFS transporter permease subunit [Mycolicibacterium chlorophenolicum]KMO68520.1 Multidrug export protein EmrB [Mycolicibacterium chlorophenolicum]
MTAGGERQLFLPLWVMMVGFLLVVVDATAIAVASPVIRETFGVDHHSVIWVSSAYLLAFAALLLLGGRLGDRYGPRNLYLLGLAVFAAASVWCGLSTSIDMLIVARLVQGVGAALITPQILTTITRTFPPERRGVAMAVWGATAGVGMFAGPLVGGVLVDTWGWPWIFFVNAPVGAAGVISAAALIPATPGRRHHLDLPGALLSAVGIGLLVFGLQEGQHEGWSLPIWGVIAGGTVLIAAFVSWQAVQRDEPLIPLSLFRHRDFVLSNAGIVLVSVAFVAFAVPLMFYLQEVCGLPPTRAALLVAPMAIATGLLAPVVGRMVDRSQARPIVAAGFLALAVGLLWLSREMTPATPVWRLLLPLTVMGAAGALTWEPLSVIASRTLPPELAGAGSAMCNTSRQIGAALSSAGVAALMTALLGSEPSAIAGPAGGAAALSGSARASLAAAMAESMLLPASAAALGAATALFLTGRARSDLGYRFRRDVSVAP